eukprot:CAMPEP_0203891812 /NCGR_PEP_ID=MMETSP0359-20131031/35057_1 /ASSEMBLY_ACC=CAM_ASM_000338 /TAXON_ID=268821 /ORGANISM="Scrippsiella Hangoei, Strain SHTV-5" /LENGTH=31 /DNA_ID= /DNA_START= /DNA_END= /DNA_ORIENTATION=
MPHRASWNPGTELVLELQPPALPPGTRARSG